MRRPSESSSDENQYNSSISSYVSTRSSTTIAALNENDDNPVQADDYSVAFAAIFNTFEVVFTAFFDSFTSMGIFAVLKIMAFLAVLLVFAYNAFSILAVVFMNFVAFVVITLVFTVITLITFLADLERFAYDVYVVLMNFVSFAVFNAIAFPGLLYLAVSGLVYITSLQILLDYIVFFVIAAAVVFKVNGSFKTEEVSNESSAIYMNELVEATYNETDEAVLTAFGDKSTCQICIENYNIGDTIVQKPCRHIFCWIMLETR